MTRLEPWVQLEELDMCLRVLVDIDFWTPFGIFCGDTLTDMKAAVAPVLRAHIKKVMGDRDIADVQASVARTIATHLPRLRKIWLWDALPYYMPRGGSTSNRSGH